MHFVILRNLRNSILAKKMGWRYLAFAQFFLRPIINSTKKASECKVHLIVSDIFPEQAAAIGLMGRGFLYIIPKAVTNFPSPSSNSVGFI
jgi:hypothetical protein